MFSTLLRYVGAVALLFALWFLATRDTGGLERLALTNPWDLLLSVFVLVAVFHVRAWMWFRFLRRCGLPVDYRLAVISRFRPILAKYVPGKIWVVMSTAELIAPFVGTFRQSVVLTVWFQFSLILSGLLTGAVGLIVLGFPAFLGRGITIVVGLALTIIALSVLSSRKIFRMALERITVAGSGEAANVTVPFMLPTHVLGVVQWVATGWAFDLFFESLSSGSVGYALFFQPVAQVAGTVFALTPGGLGTREAFTTGYLGLAGIGLGTAGALALAARIWFFAVEAILFAIGWTLRVSDGTGAR